MNATPILLVDDDAEALEYLSLVLSGDGHSVRKARDGLEALLAIESEAPLLVVSDLRMPEIDGLELLTRVGQRWPSIRCIMLTVENDTATVVEAMRRGAVNYPIKPVAPATLRAAVHKTLAALPNAPEMLGRDRPVGAKPDERDPLPVCALDQRHPIQDDRLSRLERHRTSASRHRSRERIGTDNR